MSVLNCVSFSKTLQDVVLIIGLTSLPKQFQFSSENGIYKYLVNQCYYFLTLQNYSFIILTVCLIRIPSMILDNFNKEITLTKTASINEVVDLVAKWKENWLVVCDLVADVARNDFELSQDIGGRILRCWI